MTHSFCPGIDVDRVDFQQIFCSEWTYDGHGELRLYSSGGQRPVGSIDAQLYRDIIAVSQVIKRIQKRGPNNSPRFMIHQTSYPVRLAVSPSDTSIATNHNYVDTRLHKNKA